MPNESTPTVERCQDLWYQDGTIILQAESLQFRVYGGILAENSPVFSDMFAFAQPQGDESSEGCAVVHLQDSKSDLYHFLKSLHSAGSALSDCLADRMKNPLRLHDLSTNRYYEKHRTSFAVVSALLRLGIKYDVDYFKRSAFRTLAALFPTALDDWDRRDSSQIQYFYGLPFAVVKLCRDTGLTTLLPAAMCSACFTPDGVTDILNGRISSKHGHRAELYHPDKAICLKARETLHNALRQLLLNTLLRRAVSCTSPERCNPARLESLHSLIESKMMRDSPQHIFHVKFQSLLRFHAGVCAACLTASEMSFDAARANLWSELPSFFGLPSWQELRKSLHTHGLQEPTSSNKIWEILGKGKEKRPRSLSALASLM